jgi:YhcH/YjgK/YiaL family protein
MKLYNLLMVMYLLLAVTSCGKNKKLSHSKIVKSETNWRQELYSSNVIPSQSIDTLSFAEHYKRYPERWKLAFDYLSSVKKDSLIVGKKFLSEDVFVSVDEYRTKNVLFESHRRYIDLQYVMEGEEYIGFSRYPVKEVVPYNVERDITFYNANIEQLLKADAGHFFIFFPTDLHQPCIAAEQCKRVKKIVIKIKID